ncbi:metallophosphoesterase family protein [Candidatus Bathyarchaeota archaeon]|nr:metallophosphoesterase family protein [Candidatus Bathyarchaeota archaeon]
MPAMLLEDGERVLVASDFHLGLEYELAKMGINIPYQTERILGELLSLIKEHNPERLLLIGDIKHGVPITSFQESREIHRFFSALLDEVKAIDVIRGNHDGNLQQLVPEGVAIHSSRGLILGDKYRVAAFHGHAWPSPKLMGSDLMVLGHNHPTVLLRTPLGIRASQRVWVKGRCSGASLARAFLKQAGFSPGDDPINAFRSHFKIDAKDPEVILMPAFNDLLGGLPINSEPPENLLGPLLRSGAINIDDFEVYLLDGTYLGRVGFLRGLA